MLSRYQQSRTDRDRLHTRCQELYEQVTADDGIVPPYRPGVALIAEAGMSKISDIEDQVSATESAIRTLRDPRAAIRERLARTFETNQVFKRPPASVQEANAWSREWGYGLRLEEVDGAMIARIPELPIWRHPLTRQQTLDAEAAMRHGEQLGRQLQNLDMTPQQAASANRRIENRFGHEM